MAQLLGRYPDAYAMGTADLLWVWIGMQITSIVGMLAMYAFTTDPTFAPWVFRLRRFQPATSTDEPATRCVCAVCLDDDDRSHRWITGCGHVYHRSCLYAWLQHRTNCPECRSDLRVLPWRWAVYQACVLTCRVLEQYGTSRYVP